MIKFETFYKNAYFKSCSEDFASVAVTERYTYLILSDGCSSSRGDVVLGSRWFHRNLKLKIKNYDFSFHDYIEEFKKIVVDGLKCGLSFDDFLFTIFLVRIDKKDEIANVIRIGDGSIYYKANGEVNFESFSYENEMPFYIGYFFHPDFNESFLKEFNCSKLESKEHHGFLSRSWVNKSEGGNNYPLYDHSIYDLNKIDKMFVFSDGIEQINNSESSAIYELEKSQLLDFLFKKEETSFYDSDFEKRKINFYLKNKKLMDDFSFLSLEVE